MALRDGDVHRLLALTADPQSVEPAFRVLVGRLLADLGYQALALKWLKGAGDWLSGSMVLEHQLMLARVTEKSDPEKALRYTLKALDNAQHKPKIVWRLVEKLVSLDQLDIATEVVEEYWRRNPDSAEAPGWKVRLALWGKRLEGMPELLGRLEEVDAKMALEYKGVFACLQGDQEVARSYLEKANRQSDCSKHIGLWLGEVYLRLGMNEEASECVQRYRTNSFPYFILKEILSAGRGVAYKRLSLVERQYLDKAIEERGERLSECSDGRGRLFQYLGLLGGNREEQQTWLGPDEDLRLYAGPENPDTQCRDKSANLLYSLWRHPVNELVEAFDRLKMESGTMPYPDNYRGELLLWLGRYSEALEAFSSNSRWGFVGRAAVHVLTGQFNDAFQEFEACEQRYSPVVGATTPVYRGELFRRVGRWLEARRELEVAIEDCPSRVGARCNLVLVLLELDDLKEAREHWEYIQKQAGRLLWDGVRARGGGESWPVPLEESPALLECCLEMMRGNRSSSVVSYLDEDGGLRILCDSRKFQQVLHNNRVYLHLGLQQLLVDGSQAPPV